MDNEIMKTLAKLHEGMEKGFTDIKEDLFVIKKDVSDIKLAIADMAEENTAISLRNVEPVAADLKYIEHKVLQLEREVFEIRHTQ